MPGFDGTGPNGLGPKTGRGMGRCGQGLGRGRGMGRRRFCRFTETQEPLNQQEYLENLKASKKRIEAEIEALEEELK